MVETGHGEMGEEEESTRQERNTKGRELSGDQTGGRLGLRVGGGVRRFFTRRMHSESL